eukprot:521049_1
MSPLLLVVLIHIATIYAQVEVFWHGDNGIPCIRIPAITQTTGNTLLAFAECRHWTGDGCAPSNVDIDGIEAGHVTYVCMKRSTDNGKTWTPNITYPIGTYITHSQPTVVFDKVTSTTILQVLSNSSTVWQVTSTDNGQTWTKPYDIGAQIGNQYKNSEIGPGRGLQLEYGANKGRIMFIAHHGAYEEDVIWYSDDNGKTYNLSETIFPGMDEAQLVELTNGSVIANMRNNHYFKTPNGYSYRGYSISNNGGVSFTKAIADYPSLLSPVCMSTIIGYNNKIYFANPDNAHTRINMTVKVSHDGFNFNVLNNIFTGPSAYSCLTTVGIDNTIGLLWETNSTSCSGPSCRMLFTLIDV